MTTPLSIFEASADGQAEPASPDDARLFAAVMRQMPASVLILGAPDGRVLMCSDLLHRIYGERIRQVRSWRDMSALGILHPDGRPYASEEYPVVRALLHGEEFKGAAYAVRKQGGEVGWSETWTAPVRDEEGRIVAAVGAAVDVTARRQAEAALEASEARFRALTETLPQLVWATRLDGWCYYLSPQWVAYTGVPEEAHHGTGWQDALHPDDRARAAAAWARAVAEQAPYDLEYRLRRHDGVYRWFKVRCVRVRDPGAADGMFGTSTDIDDLKSAEAALQDSQSQLREALAARELVVREADHRIRNSLQLVGSLITLQRSKLADSEAAAALDAAAARVQAVGEVHRALEASPDLRTVAFGGMLCTLCDLLGRLNPAIAFACDAPGDLDLDAERAIPMGLIVNELLTNAAKYAYAPDRPGWVRLSAIRAERALRVVVQDGGAGLPPAPAEPAPPSLGTAIIRALARKIGATLDVRSGPGEGTTAVVDLPAQTA